MSEYNPVVGKKLINQLMFSLYADERVIFREYIQNASDSIIRAVDRGILEAVKDGNAQVNISKSKHEIVISDNGAGISSDIAVQTLLDISNSGSNGIDQAGQYGIGRLVGAGYCKKLTFKTSCKGENVATVVTLDSELAKSIVNDKNDKSLASEVMSRISSTYTVEENVDNHYFEVRLEGVLDRYSATLLDVDSVRAYLIEVAPIDFESSFKNTLIRRRDSNPEFLALYEDLRHISVFVNGGKRLSKGYTTNIVGSGDSIDHLEYFHIESEEYGRLGWGWIALTKFSVQISANDPMRCIRLRKHNIQIGNQNTLSARTIYWKEDRSNSYFYGEIHATHPNITPNAARDGLAPTPEAQEFNKLLNEQFVIFKRLYEKANAAKNSVSHIREAITKLEKEQTETPIVLNKYQATGVDVFNRLENQETDRFLKSMIQLYKPDVDSAIREYKELQDQIKNSSQPFPTDSYTHNVDARKEQQRPATSQGSNSNGLQKGTKQENSKHKEPITESPQMPIRNEGSTSDSPYDLLSPLKDKYSKSELMLIRKILASMTIACPPNMKMQFEQMKHFAVTKLMKP